MPGQEVLVEFVAGDPAQPVVRSYVDGTPVSVKLDATATFDLAPSAKVECTVAPIAAAVNIGAAGITRVGPGVQPVALAPGVLALVGALGTFAELMKPIIAASTAKPADVTAADGAAKALVTACADAAQSIPATKVYGG